MSKYQDILNASEPKVIFLKCDRHVIEDADYRAMEGLNQSYLKKVYTHGVPHAENQRLNPMEKTPALVMGSLFHTLVLEEDQFNNRYAVLPDLDRRTKEGKLLYAEFEAASGGKDLIKEADLNTAMRMRDSAAPLMYEGVRPDRTNAMNEVSYSGILEVEYKWKGEDERIELPFKIRCDMVVVLKEDEKNIIEIRDIKSLASLSDNDVIGSAKSHLWSMQCAFYRDVVYKHDYLNSRFVYVATEKEAPNMSRRYVCSEEMYQRGRAQYKQALVKYAQWLKAGKPSTADYVGESILNA
jgi:exodeoxyribonuclease VIII